MSDIRFIEAQGNLLDAAITEADRQKQAPFLKRGRSPRRPRGRSALVGIAVAAVVAGCAVAAGLLSSGQRLAIGRVDCYYGTGFLSTNGLNTGSSDAIATNATLIAGETPTTLCQQDFRQYSDYTLTNEYGFVPVHDPQLLACKKNATTAAVFIASGTSNQCEQLGLTPLPSDFAAASDSARALATDLQKLYLSRDCWAPDAFVPIAEHALRQHGFEGWRVVVSKDSGLFGGGRCAQVSAPNPNSNYSPLAFQSLDGVDRTLTLGLSIPRSLNLLINQVDEKLGADLGSRCYSRAGVRTLIDRTFASSGMTPKVAITTMANGGKGFSWGTAAETHHYAKNCPVLADVWPTHSDQTVLVWLNARNGTYLRGYTNPPLADFQTS